MKSGYPLQVIGNRKRDFHANEKHLFAFIE
jgi:hypothetical protein